MGCDAIRCDESGEAKDQKRKRDLQSTVVRTLHEWLEARGWEASTDGIKQSAVEYRIARGIAPCCGLAEHWETENR